MKPRELLLEGSQIVYKALQLSGVWIARVAYKTLRVGGVDSGIGKHCAVLKSYLGIGITSYCWI